MSQIINKITKLIELAGNNPNEHERIAAALKACEMIRTGEVSITEGKHMPNLDFDWASGWSPNTNEQLSAQKEFYHKIVLMNGSPVYYPLKWNGRCSLCNQDMKVGQISTWIPKTRYVFHPACWSMLKVRTTPY